MNSGLPWCGSGVRSCEPKTVLAGWRMPRNSQTGLQMGDSALCADVQTKMGFCSAMFSIVVKLVPNFAAISLLHVFAQATAQPADRALPQLAARRSTYRVTIKLAIHFFGNRVRWIYLPLKSTRIRDPLQTYSICLPKLLGTVCAPYAHCIRVWDRLHESPSSMSAVALTHCAKIQGFIAQN